MTPLGSKGLSHSICTERDVSVTGRGGGWSVGGAGRVWSFLSGPRLQHWLHKRWFLKDLITFTQKKSKCLNEQALLIPDNRCRPQLQPNIEWKGVNHEASAAGRFPLRATGWKFSHVLDCHKRKHKGWVKKRTCLPECGCCGAGTALCKDWQPRWVWLEDGCPLQRRLQRHVETQVRRHPQVGPDPFSHWPTDWHNDQLNSPPTPAGYEPQCFWWKLPLINQYSPQQQRSVNSFTGLSIKTTISGESGTFSPCNPTPTYLHDNYFSPSSRSYSQTHTLMVILFVCLCWV